MVTLAALLGGGSALADVMLHPTRVVFEGNKRAAQLEIINRSTETGVYRLRLVHKRMTELGEFVSVDAPMSGELFADDLVRFSPRQIELAPGASQTVRLMLRKPADLAAGEYRSHLLFERLPNPETSSSDRRPPGTELEIKLVPLMNVSIPVLVRHGETSAAVEIADLQMETVEAGKRALALTLHRDGNRSVYGDIVVYFTPKRGKEQIVGRAGGVAVYTPNPLRRGRVILLPAARTPLSAGTLRVTYSEQPQSGGKMLAEGSLQLP